jgi:Cu(I)/Ag(I) efflux system membrane protein CusA/SilA
MIARIIEFSAKNRFIVILFVLLGVGAGLWAARRVPLDALPDLSDTQVIVYTTWMGRSPDLVEDQVTYPIISALLSAPKVTVVRGFSDFGYSYVYVLFEEGTDIYWARSRVLEYLQQITGSLPAGVRPALGPDATGVGWVYQYALVDRSGRHSLADLRSLQDWYLRYALASVDGVAEVAPVGGFVRQYQVQLDPVKLAAFGLTLPQVLDGVRAANVEVGGRVIEFGGREYMVRGRGYLRGVGDLESVALGTGRGGTPIRLAQVASVALGPDMRRGIAELDGEGEVVGGVVVMRHEENALEVIGRVEAKLAELRPSLPQGVEVVTVYDRSDLIRKSIDTVTASLLQELLIVSAMILVFLLHFRSALVPIIGLPVAVIIAFLPMYWMRLTINIMSLGGIVIAIGDMVDASIVLIENAHKRLEEWERHGRAGKRVDVLIGSMKEVGPPIFASLLVMAIAFMPVFMLQAQEGRLFKPLAFTKNFSIALSAILAITLTPALITLLVRGRIRPEADHPVSRGLIRAYEPMARWVLRWPKLTVCIALAAALASVPALLRIGSEFMPPLAEGSILYMPTTPPGISVTEAGKLLQVQDKLLRGFPEVERVFGKVGRAESSTDPAPFSMMETTVLLKPESEWRKVAIEYPQWVPGFARRVLPRERRMRIEDLTNLMDEELRLPGAVNAWTMPIKNRIDMLTTGIRTPVGIKIFGRDLEEIQRVGTHLEGILRDVPGTRSVYAERVASGYFLDVEVKREAIARYGLSVADVAQVVERAIGGETVTTTVEGRERYSVNVRYMRETRDDLDALQRLLVTIPMPGAQPMATARSAGMRARDDDMPVMEALVDGVGGVAGRGRDKPSGALPPGSAADFGPGSAPQVVQVPLGQLADLRYTTGPAMIRDEDGLLAGYVYVDLARRDIGGYVDDAKAAVQRELIGAGLLPAGYHLTWSGQYEYMQRVKARLRLFVPLTLVIIFLLYFFTFRSVTETLIVMLSVPLALVGGVWLLFAVGYNLSIAVWVGLIALAGIAAETAAVMIVYLDAAYARAKREGRMRGLADLHAAVMEGAVQRLRPKVMTVAANLLGLLPVLWSHGTGADVMKRIAAPLWGGLLSSSLLTLFVLPALFVLWKWHAEVKHANAGSASAMLSGPGASP